MEDQTKATDLLQQCQELPVAYTGAIQSHGALLAIDHTENIIRYISLNIHDFIKLSDESWLGRSVQKINNASLQQITQVDLFELISTEHQGQLEVSCIITDDYKIYELIKTTDKGQKLAQNISDGLASLLKADSIESLHQHSIKELQTIIDFEHMMVYQFDDDWNGQVVAEHITEGKEDTYGSYLNLHFPESDVPSQARELYTKQWLRVISDVLATPVPLKSLTDTPLDLSFCGLRSVSPSHIQYLKNMGVTASLSISILIEGKLWGLVAAHDTRPHPLDSSVQQAAVELGKLYSSMLTLKLKQTHQNWLDQNKNLLQWPIESAQDGKDPLETTNKQLEILCHTFDATGVAICFDNRQMTHGIVPKKYDLLSLLEDLEVMAMENDCFITEEISEQFFKLKENDVAGLFAIGAPQADNRWVLIFRQAEPQEINWGGDPRPEAMQPRADILTPRTSFKKWQETLTGRSRHWGSQEKVLGKALANNLLLAHSTLATLESAQKTAKLNMLNMLLHDIGNAISGVSGAISQMRHILNDTSATHQLTRLQIMTENHLHKFDEILGTGKGNALVRLLSEVIQLLESNNETNATLAVDVESGLTHVRELLDLQKGYANSDKVYARECHLAELILDSLSIMRTSIETRGAYQINLASHIPPVNTDRSKAMQIILNLIKNSYEAWDMRQNDKPPFLIVLSSMLEGDLLKLDIRDNGVGFDQVSGKHLFSKKYSTKSRSSGLGLANAQRLADASGITVQLSSAGVNQGAVATLIFAKEIWA